MEKVIEFREGLEASGFTPEVVQKALQYNTPLLVLGDLIERIERKEGVIKDGKYQPTIKSVP